MKIYTTKTTVRIGAGCLALTEAQAAARSHALGPAVGNCYPILRPVEFKAGETFGHDLAIPKAIAACLEETGDLADLEDKDQAELRAMAEQLGLRLHPNLGKAKIIEAIQERQDQVARELVEVAARATRIAELESLLEPTEADLAELTDLKAQV